ncbi:unnamed protein product, partial [Aureobasidium pullulans]
MPPNNSSTSGSGSGSISSSSTGSGSYEVTSSGTNDQGKPLLLPRLRLRCFQRQLLPLLQQSRFILWGKESDTNDVRDSDGSYYYSNPNGSTYYNSGSGYSNYTPQGK